jgi:diguanylate cyclase (GGDEF)-like protein
MEALEAAERGLREAAETASHAAHVVAELLESAVQLAADSEAIRWCAYLTTAHPQDGATDGDGGDGRNGAVGERMRVLHGYGDGAPAPGTVWSAAEVAHPLDSGHANAFTLPSGLGGQQLLLQPVRAGEEPGALGALRRLVAHVQDLLERVPTDAATEGHDTGTAEAQTAVLPESDLRQRLTEEVARAQRYGGTLSVLVLDVDETGTLSRELEARTVGNEVAPEALRVIGDALGRSLRQMDRVGRLGADRFAVLLPETGAEESLTAGERLGRAVGLAVEAHAAQTMRQPPGVSPEADVTPSYELRVGVSTFPLAAQSADGLIEQADAAVRSARAMPEGGWLRHALPHLNERGGRGYRCVCRRCGKVFDVDDRAHQRARRYCSHACYVSERREAERTRDDAIRAARAGGQSLREIAARHSMSAERVRQICATPAQ